jgi:hypothetical protein
MGEMVPIVLFVSMFSMIVLVVFIGTRQKQRRIETLAAVQTRMLDKFGSAAEFVTFLQSPEGKNFLTTASEVRVSPADRIFSSIRSGIILTLLGVAFTILSFTTDDGMIVPGVLLLAIGIGFLISAMISHRLSNAWGLLNRNESTPGAYVQQ